jgi:transposase
MKRYIQGADRGQSTFLPECLDDWIAEDNPVRAINAFVDALDLAALGFKVQPAETGRPSFHPSVHLKLYIYGYVNRVPSSRRLEREAGRNLEVIWLLGRLVPDDKVIADFRKDNGPAIRKVCAQFVELCRKLGLLTRASVAIDGSKFKAVNDRDKNFTRNKLDRRRKQLEESVARYLGQLDTADRQEPSEALSSKTAHLKEKIARIGEELKKLDAIETQMLASPDRQISLTDPGANRFAVCRAMPGPWPRAGAALAWLATTCRSPSIPDITSSWRTRSPIKVTTAPSLPTWPARLKKRWAWKSSTPLRTGVISTARKS